MPQTTVELAPPLQQAHLHGAIEDRFISRNMKRGEPMNENASAA